jgi:hypothetical protein
MYAECCEVCGAPPTPFRCSSEGHLCKKSCQRAEKGDKVAGEEASTDSWGPRIDVLSKEMCPKKSPCSIVEATFSANQKTEPEGKKLKTREERKMRMNRTPCERPVQASVFLLCAICYVSRISIATGAHGIFETFPFFLLLALNPTDPCAGISKHLGKQDVALSKRRGPQDSVFVVVRVMRVCVRYFHGFCVCTEHLV